MAESYEQSSDELVQRLAVVAQVAGAVVIRMDPRFSGSGQGTRVGYEVRITSGSATLARAEGTTGLAALGGALGKLLGSRSAQVIALDAGALVLADTRALEG